MEKPKDNSTLWRKVLLRKAALRELAEPPVVLEAFGGYGQLFNECYQRFERGVVLEKDSEKVDYLASQRPTWSVYECDNVTALAAGAGSHLKVNFLDLDAWGDPFGALRAFLQGHGKTCSPRLLVVVTDGWRRKVQHKGAWHTKELGPFVQRFGNDLAKDYLALAREVVTAIASGSGFEVESMKGYYCGHANLMAHYRLILNRA